MDNIFKNRKDKKSMDLLDILKHLYFKNDQLKMVFGDSEFLSYIISDLEDVILDQYGIPLDETLKNPKGYCRDYFYELLYDFGKKKIAKEQIVKEILKNVKKTTENKKMSAL